MTHLGGEYKKQSSMNQRKALCQIVVGSGSGGGGEEGETEARTAAEEEE